MLIFCYSMVFGFLGCATRGCPTSFILHLFLLLYIALMLHLFCDTLPLSGVAGEGSGVIVEGSVPITGEAVATPPVSDTKVSTSLSRHM